LHLVISLPNQLFGHVPITQISKPLTARLSSLSAESDEEDDENEDEEEKEEDVPSLEALFEVGKFVRARVSALFGVGQSNPAGLEGWKPRDENEKSCRRVELTLDPEVVNEGVAKIDLEEGFVSSPAFCAVAFDRGCTGCLTLRSISTVDLDRCRLEH
jgi:rRNA biogenesis protein RRP5